MQQEKTHEGNIRDNISPLLISAKRNGEGDGSFVKCFSIAILIKRKLPPPLTHIIHINSEKKKKKKLQSVTWLWKLSILTCSNFL